MHGNAHLSRAVSELNRHPSRLAMYSRVDEFQFELYCTSECDVATKSGRCEEYWKPKHIASLSVHGVSVPYRPGLSKDGEHPTCIQRGFQLHR